MNVLDLLGEKDFIKIPKPLIIAIGIDGALAITEIASGYNYWESCGQAEDGWVLPSVHDLEQRLHFDPQKQIRLLGKLERIGILFVRRGKEYIRSRPQKRALKINEDAIKNIFLWNKD